MVDQKKAGEFDFWQDHSIQYLKMAFSTERRERIENADAYGRNKGECGDTVEFFLMVSHGTIQSISFETNGCMNTNACAGTAAFMAEGKRIDQAWEITPEKISNYLETLPPESYHCAEIAVGALYRALANYREMRRSPWKKSYQVAR